MEQSTLARRGLLAAVIGMGLLIVLGTCTLMAVIVHRMSHRDSKISSTPVPAQAEKTVSLDEPSGTTIAQIAWQSGPLLALRLAGGGPDRIVLWDTASGRIAGRLKLTP